MWISRWNSMVEVVAEALTIRGKSARGWEIVDGKPVRRDTLVRLDDPLDRAQTRVMGFLGVAPREVK